ncbi:MAG: BamA/TamA family outer membrane protein, partial [Verrucomicrobiota bacterium]|nr:BamA/TamA family outer membrane protein [Verrucomicrobiota bacterium]
GLRREEASFIREEFGGGFGGRKRFPGLSSEVGLRYSYQVLNAEEFPVSPEFGRKEANVGAIIGDWRHDQRDNPLYPRRGFKVFSTLEIASDYLGGNVDYQRFEANAAWHIPLLRGSWFNLGVTHGLIASVGTPAEDLPFNRRFFPGGENSVRGYQYGEAAPRDQQGNLIGAEAFTVGNIEFEQALTRSWSLVFFFDAVGFAQNLRDYPFDEGLYSAGGGLRWKTIIGPARLEYGHNLNRRAQDPAGTLHFSIGFPF